MSGSRVAGCDPGTSRLDALVLEEGEVLAQTRLSPAQVRDDPFAIVRRLHSNGPPVLVVAPLGYGLPLIRAAQGAAILADGLAGSHWATLVDRLGIGQAKGTASAGGGLSHHSV